jgi:hypothetical protein
MIIETVEGAYGVTLADGNYNTVRIEAKFYGRLEPGDDADRCAGEARARAMQVVDGRVQELKRMGAPITDFYTQPEPPPQQVNGYYSGPQRLPKPATMAQVEAHLSPGTKDAPEMETVPPQPVAAPAEQVDEDQFAKDVLAACIRVKKSERAGQAFYEGYLSTQSRDKQQKFLDEHPDPNKPKEHTMADKVKGLIAALTNEGADLVEIDGLIASVCDGQSNIDQLSPEHLAKARLSLERLLEEMKRQRSSGAAR